MLKFFEKNKADRSSSGTVSSTQNKRKHEILKPTRQEPRAKIHKQCSYVNLTRENTKHGTLVHWPSPQTGSIKIWTPGLHKAHRDMGAKRKHEAKKRSKKMKKVKDNKQGIKAEETS